MLNQWIIDDAVETLTRAAERLHRVAEAIEKEAEGIRKNGGDSIGDARLAAVKAYFDRPLTQAEVDAVNSYYGEI